MSGMENKHREEYIYELIKPVLIDCLNKENAPESVISFRLGQEDNSNYSSIFIDTMLLIRIRFRGKKNFLGVSKIFYDQLKSCLPKDLQTDCTKSDPDFIRILIDSPEQVTEFSDFIAGCTMLLLDNLATQFDCCSRYEECSDSMQCVNPDQKLALGCSYRKKLRAGIAYYGKNAVKSKI